MIKKQQTVKYNIIYRESSSSQKKLNKLQVFFCEIRKRLGRPSQRGLKRAYFQFCYLRYFSGFLLQFFFNYFYFFCFLFVFLFVYLLRFQIKHIHYCCVTIHHCKNFVFIFNNTICIFASIIMKKIHIKQNRKNPSMFLSSHKNNIPKILHYGTFQFLGYAHLRYVKSFFTKI